MFNIKVALVDIYAQNKHRVPQTICPIDSNKDKISMKT